MINDIYDAGFDKNLTRYDAATNARKGSMSYSEQVAQRALLDKNLQIYKKGILYVDNFALDGTGDFYEATGTVNHGLGYTPVFECFAKLNAVGTTLDGNWVALPYTAESPTVVTFALRYVPRCNNTTLQVRVVVGAALNSIHRNVPIPIYYYIYKDKMPI